MISGLTWPNQWNPFEIAPMAMGLTFTSLQSPILYFLSGLGIDQLSPVLSQWPWCQMDMKHRHFTNTTFFFEDYIWLRMIQSFVILDLHVLENFPLVFLNHCSSSLFISHFCIFWFAFPAKLPVQCLCFLVFRICTVFGQDFYTLISCAIAASRSPHSLRRGDVLPVYVVFNSSCSYCSWTDINVPSVALFKPPLSVLFLGGRRGQNVEKWIGRKEWIESRRVDLFSNWYSFV